MRRGGSELNTPTPLKPYVFPTHVGVVLQNDLWRRGKFSIPYFFRGCSERILGVSKNAVVSPMYVGVG
jgi:hypothetical protein